MSPNGRWEGSKIVVPPTRSREKELIGGLKNATERGETLMKAQQSFINAGYSKEEVIAAARKVSAGEPQKKTSVPTNPQAQPAAKVPEKISVPGKKEASKTIKIILIVASALVLIGAALLGIFWDKIFA